MPPAHRLPGRLLPIVAAACLGTGGVALAQTPPLGPVVISEIFHHPPDERPGLQWIEIFNRGPVAVDLSGWSFSKGVRFGFPAGARLQPGAFAVVVADAGVFAKAYGSNLPVAGVFAGRQGSKGERIELSDAAGKSSDWVHYRDRYPWSVAADGSGRSLERIHSGSRSDIPGNWVASMPGRGSAPAGTPGTRNAADRTNLPPVPSEVRFDPLPRDRPNAASVRWNDDDGVTSASVEYRVGTPQGWSAYRSLPMARVSGKTTAGEYAVSLPVPPEGSVVRFRLRARDGAGGERVWPPPQETVSEFSYLVLSRPERATIGQLQLWTQGRAAPAGASVRNRRSSRRPEESAANDLTAIHIPPAGGGDPELHDFVRVSERAGGWKLRNGKGQPLLGMHTANVIFESNPRWVLAEHLAYELFRRAGVPTPESGHFRLSVDGEDLGYHLYVEQPDQAFLARHGRDTDGNLYKILWYENGLVRQHEKKNHPARHHEDLKEVVAGLRDHRAGDPWSFIRERFDVDGFAAYYAVSQCIENWDGFFNNHFLYHAPGPGGRWEIYPWDEDKTWGDYDGASRRFDWYSMPLTFGMNGDKPPDGGASFGTGPFGGTSWWRPGGWFSGPLLANPGFRERFLGRLRGLCATEFTEEKFRPVIDALETRLEPEVRHRAAVLGAEEEPMLARFHADIDSFRRQVVNRRRFILGELDRAK
ncbi:MAG: hypothetical protein DVB31_12920 [Verrucomicrobia bacterium]|nr:MAG: hypothetical protein DVB31_12920 [Verrucomicrobiota bacterium]